MGTIRHELAELVIKECATNSLVESLKKYKVNAQNFFKTLAEVPSLDDLYARAQKSRSELLVDEIVQISDTEEDPQRARNRIDARKWYASKMQPQKFGDRIDVNVNQTVDIRGALDEAKNRIRNVLEISKIQAIETTSAIFESTTGSKPVEIGSTALNELEDLLK